MLQLLQRYATIICAEQNAWVQRRDPEWEGGKNDFGLLPALPATDTNQSCDWSRAAILLPSLPQLPQFAPSETKTTSPHIWKDEDQFKMICLMDANGITPQRLNYQSKADKELEERLSGSSSELRQSSSQVKEIRQRRRSDKDRTCYL